MPPGAEPIPTPTPTLVPTPAPTLLRGVDRAAFAVSFAVRLRAAGVTVGLTGVEDFIRALAAQPPRRLSLLYWAARVTLVQRRSDLETFDAVFATVFDEVGLALDPHARRRPVPAPSDADDTYLTLPTPEADLDDAGGLPWATLPPAVATADDSDVDLAVPERMPGELEALADQPFEQLDAREMELLGRWLHTVLVQWPTRRSMRRRPGPAGPHIALRPTLARARRTGWEPLELIRTRQVDKPRRVVMLCDVSQSMQAQAGAYFHLMRALALVADAEVFAFSTTLTRLTPVLTHKSAAVAMSQATDKVTDRFGGTRIATNLQTLLASHHGGATRGAIVIIGSDGWDSDAPAALGAAMARLRRRAHRVIWMNPRASAPGFAPLVSTLAAALPYCHEMLPAADFRSLVGVVEAIARIREPSRPRVSGGAGARSSG